MEISVQLVQEDLLSHRKTILADGKGNYSNRVLTYQEKDNPHIKHEISFCDDYVILKRHAEIKTETYLVKLNLQTTLRSSIISHITTEGLPQ